MSSLLEDLQNQEPLEENQEKPAEEVQEKEEETPAFLKTSSVEPIAPPPFSIGAADKETFASHFAKLDEEEDEEENEDGEDEDGEQDAKKGPGRPRTRNLAQEAAKNELDDLLDGIDFHLGNVRMELHRMEPLVTEDGVACDGFLDRYSRTVSLDEIKKKYGGGRYQATIKGPSDDGRRQNIIRGRKAFTIAGMPLMPRSKADLEREREKEANKQKDILSTLLEKQERSEERSRQELMLMQQKAEQSTNAMLQMVLKMQESKPDQLTPVIQLMQQESKERRDMELREKEERARLDSLAMQERQLAWEREKEERREEARREEARRAEEVRRYEAQMQQQRQEAQAQQQMQMQMMQNMMTMMASVGEKGSQASNQYLTQISNLQNQNTSQMMEFMKQSMKKDGGMAETLQTLSVMRDFISPPSIDDRTTAEKVLDKVGEMAPAVMGGLASLGGQRQPQIIQNPVAGPMPVQYQPQLPPPQQIGIVEDYEDAEEMPRATSPEEDVQQDNKNPMTEFPDKPYEGLDLQQGIAVLLQLIDLGIQKELSSEELFEKAIKTMPVTQRSMLKMAPADTLIEFVTENIPETWDIRSAAGEEMIRALKALA